MFFSNSTHIPWKDVPLVKVNYQYEKRQKELEKKRKKEQKLRLKQNKKNNQPNDGSPQPEIETPVEAVPETTGVTAEEK